MIIFCLLIILVIIYILFKLILYLIIKKINKNSHYEFSIAGFSYNTEKDIFYSTKNAWQKNFGYTHIYDVLAPVFRMIIDTEPVRFYYNNKNWLITFWKGQYGIVTGAEIGIYCTKQKYVDKKTVYLPVSKNEMLNMSLALYKNGKEITKVASKHWWLAAFKLGMFSKPKDLSMDISITFPNHEMLSSFLKSFKELGYRSNDFIIKDNTFYFQYTKPHTHKVWTRSLLTDSISQFLNHKNVQLYNKYLNEFIKNNEIDFSKIKNTKNPIIISNLLINLIKNITDNKSKQIIKHIYNEKNKNIVLLNSKIGVNK